MDHFIVGSLIHSFIQGGVIKCLCACQDVVGEVVDSGLVLPLITGNLCLSYLTAVSFRFSNQKWRWQPLTYVTELSWQPIVIKAVEGICKGNPHEHFSTLSSLPYLFPCLKLASIDTHVTLARDAMKKNSMIANIYETSLLLGSLLSTQMHDLI